MTMVQEATWIMQQMPRQKQQVILDLLRIMNTNNKEQKLEQENKQGFRRTGKAAFRLSPDFDEHFDDLNDEIAAMFSGESA